MIKVKKGRGQRRSRRNPRAIVISYETFLRGVFSRTWRPTQFRRLSSIYGMMMIRVA